MNFTGNELDGGNKLGNISSVSVGTTTITGDVIVGDLETDTYTSVNEEFDSLNEKTQDITTSGTETTITGTKLTLNPTGFMVISTPAISCGTAVFNLSGNLLGSSTSTIGNGGNVFLSTHIAEVNTGVIKDLTGSSNIQMNASSVEVSTGQFNISADVVPIGTSTLGSSTNPWVLSNITQLEAGSVVTTDINSPNVITVNSGAGITLTGNTTVSNALTVFGTSSFNGVASFGTASATTFGVGANLGVGGNVDVGGLIDIGTGTNTISVDATSKNLVYTENSVAYPIAGPTVTSSGVVGSLSIDSTTKALTYTDNSIEYPITGPNLSGTIDLISNTVFYSDSFVELYWEASNGQPQYKILNPIEDLYYDHTIRYIKGGAVGANPTYLFGAEGLETTSGFKYFTDNGNRLATYDAVNFSGVYLITLCCEQLSRPAYEYTIFYGQANETGHFNVKVSTPN
jgi:hypothetical protein